MSLLQIHTFESGVKSSVLCDENSIERRFITLKITLHSLLDHYGMQAFADCSSHGRGNTTTWLNIYFTKPEILHVQEFNNLTSNKDRVNYCCHLLGVPEIWPSS